MKHREVVLFAVGLMSDPTPLVDHVYQMLINDRLKQMRSGEHYYSSLSDNELLKSLYTESQVQLPGHPLHNQHINYYDHSDDDIDIRPIYIQSKTYEFRNIKKDIVMATEHREQEWKIPECSLTISLQGNDYQARKRLFCKCQVIMRNQAINNLFMEYINPLDFQGFPLTFAFNISKQIQLLTIKRCKFPSQILNHLMEQINQCSTMCHLGLQYTSLEAVSSLTLSNKVSLTYLNLFKTNMSRELSWSICQQLTGLTQLEHLNLSENILSHVGKILLSNKPNLSHLNCCATHMSTKLNKNVIDQVRYITHLSKLNLSDNILTGCLCNFLPDLHPGLPELHELNLRNTRLNYDDVQHLLSIAYKLPKLHELDLSGNTLTGCLSSFLPDPHPGLPQLRSLNLARTELNKDDLQHLTHLIQTLKLPGLMNLYLSHNRFDELETNVKHLIEVCSTYQKRGLWLFMGSNGLSHAFQEILKQRCAGKMINLFFFMEI